MKRLVTYLALLAMLANSAMAGVIVTPTNVGSAGGFDIWDLRITGYTGADAVPDNTISGIEGIFAATTGFMSWTGTTATLIRNNASNVLSGSGTGSWANFDSYAVNPTRTGTATQATALGATWFTVDTATRLGPIDLDAGTVDDNGLDNTLLGQLFLTPGGVANFTGKINTSAINGGAFTINIGGAPPVGDDPVAVTAIPASGTARTATAGTNTVQVSNAAVVVNPRDTAVLSALSVTSNAGTFSQTGMSNGNIAPGGSQTATIAFDKTGLLNGYTATGNLSFAIAGGPTVGGTGIGNYTYPLSQVVSGNTGNGTAPIAAGGSYAGLSGTSDLVSAGGSVHLPSTFTILGGTNSVGGATTVSAIWSLRALNEQRPGSLAPGSPLPDFASALTSDRVDITGTAGDIFVLQMSYDPTQLEGNEADDAAKGHLFVTSFNPATQKWVNSVDLNIGANTGAANVQGAWSGQLALGTWGVDIGANQVWAVLDHNSLFASVPEPSTIILGLMGLVGLVGFARRRRS